jgi:hypothetical protein
MVGSGSGIRDKTFRIRNTGWASVSDPNPDPHSMASWIRIQKGGNQLQKKVKDQQKI